MSMEHYPSCTSIFQNCTWSEKTIVGLLKLNNSCASVKNCWSWVAKKSRLQCCCAIFFGAWWYPYLDDAIWFLWHSWPERRDLVRVPIHTEWSLFPVCPIEAEPLSCGSHTIRVAQLHRAWQACLLCQGRVFPEEEIGLSTSILLPFR